MNFEMLTFIVTVGACTQLSFPCIKNSLNPVSTENRVVCDFISRNSTRPLPEYCLIKHRLYEIQRRIIRFY